MYYNKYLRRPDVPGASRCKFTFDKNADLLTTDDNYRGKKRYRFNKWHPISESFPKPSSGGLIFNPNQEHPVTGIISPWVINPSDEGYVDFLISPVTVNKFDAAAGDVIEVGVGFLKYMSDYWSLIQACEMVCRRRSMLPNAQRQYYTLNNGEIPFSQRIFNPDSYAGFQLRYDITKLEIVYTEYDAAGSVLNTDTTTLPYDNTVGNLYHPVLYFYSVGDCNFEVSLIRSKIEFPMLRLSTTETIYFLENPSAFTPPVAQLRDPGNHMYYQPSKAMIEDATITVANNWCSHEWLRTLDYLISAGLETFIFTDPDGRNFRCCFEELQANTARLTGSKGVGYELTMPVMVLH